MTVRRQWVTLAAAALLAASPVRAEDTNPPRIEIGGGVSAIVPIVHDGQLVAGIGPRITMNVTPKVAVEALIEVLGPVESSGIPALYQLQLKLAIRKSRDGKGTMSLTLGAAGLASYQHFRETRIVRPDGSTVVYHEFRRLEAGAPTMLAVGMARERQLSRHLSSCLGIQGYVGPIGGIALRVSAGMSFGIGGYR